ncbi:MAG: hypothetical protein ACK46X_02355 [Candidatus Sericytochromatia bacterium]
MTNVLTFKLQRGRTFEWPAGAPRAATFVENLAEAHRVESGSLESVAMLQGGLIQALVAHVRAHSPCWAARLAGVDAWEDVPILDRAALEAQVAIEGPLETGQPNEAIKRLSTSGSSGRAIAFYRTGRSAYMNRLRYTLDHLEQGRDLTSKLAMTKYNAVPTERPTWNWPTNLSRYVPTGPSTLVNHTDMSPPALARWLKDAQPAYLFTTSPVLDLLTEVWLAEPALAPRLEQVATFSFNLTSATREAVLHHTGARIADRYSSEEVGPIAFQCPHSHTRYHVATSNVMVEIVDQAGRPAEPGVLGRVLVTALHNYATPFIRYELGDLAAMGEGCPCGHAGPIITELAGRARSFILVGPGEYRNFTLRARQWVAAAPVREYRVQQAAMGRLEAEVVADVPLDEAALERLRALITANSPAGFHVSVRQVEAIDWGPGYKRLEFRCLV